MDDYIGTVFCIMIIVFGAIILSIIMALHFDLLEIEKNLGGNITQEGDKLEQIKEIINK
jgi:hypothetical protein